jgi:hypothetical protein
MNRAIANARYNYQEKGLGESNASMELSKFQGRMGTQLPEYKFSS